MRDDPQGCGNCGYYLKNILKFLLSHIGLISLVVGYTIIGAFLFENLEKKQEIEVKLNITKTRHMVTNKLWDMSDKSIILKEEEWTSKARRTLEDFEKELIIAVKEKGWDGKEDVNELRWTFAGSLFYSIILITTIGYGHIAPKTNTGKVMTILYAIPGVPLMMLCLANIGDGMAHSFRFLYWKVCCYACTKRPRRKQRRTNSQLSRRSRASSYRNPKRGSQRSADSHLSDPEFFAYSSHYKYYDDMDPREDRRSATLPSRAVRAREEERRKEQERSIHKSVPNVRSSIRSNHRPNHLKVSNDEIAQDGEGRGSVLFNKYAMEKVEKDKKGKTTSTPNVLTDDRMRNDRDNRDREREMEKEKTSKRDEDHRDLENSRRNPSRDRVREPEGIHRSRRDESPDAGYRGDSGYYSRTNHLARLEKEYYYDEEYYEDEDEEEVDMVQHSERPVPIWLGVMLVVMYIIAGAILFNHWEKWPFLDSVYFCFITLTTIGFGDFVPAQNNKNSKNTELSIALCSLYLLFGIALLAMSFNLVQEEVISNVKTVAKRLGILKEEEEEEEV